MYKFSWRIPALGQMSLLGAALMGAIAAGPAHALQGTLIVHGPSNIPLTGCNNPVSNGGWLMNDSPVFPLLSTFVSGPSTPPYGAGSINQSNTANTDQARALLFQPAASGLPISLFLTVIQSVTYSDYNSSPYAGGGATFNIFASYDNGATIGDSLIFAPGNNSCFGISAWSTCTFSLSSGLFINQDPTKNPAGVATTPFTIQQYATYNAAANGGSGPKFPTYPANPQAGIISTGTAGLNANFDGVILNAAAPLAGPFDDILFDFEADCSAYGTDTDGDCYCETADPTVLNYDQCPGVNDGGDTDGDNVHDCADNCPADANATQSDADGDNIGDVCDDEDSAIGVGYAKVSASTATAQGDFLLVSPDTMNFSQPFTVTIEDAAGHTATQSFATTTCKINSANTKATCKVPGTGKLVLKKLPLFGAEIWKYQATISALSFTAPFTGPIDVTLSNGSVDRLGQAATCIELTAKVLCRP